ncbi:hypothetical protein [Nocardioides zeae]
MARTQRQVTDADRLQIAALHAKGLSRNAISRETGWSAGAVTNVCTALGLTFDRSTVQAATAARKADAAQLRSELELQLLEDAQRLRAKVWLPHEYREYGGRDHTLRKWRQDEPTPLDQKHLMQAAGIALDRAVRLGELDKADEVEAAKSMLAKLLEGLGLVAGEYDPTEATA